MDNISQYIDKSYLYNSSKCFIEKYAPQELIYFDDIFEEYINFLSERQVIYFRESNDDLLIINRDFGFTSPSLDQIFTTQVISAIIIGVFKLIEFNTSKNKENKSITKIEFQNSEIQMLQNSIIPALRNSHIGETRANQIANEIIISILKNHHTKE